MLLPCSWEYHSQIWRRVLAGFEAWQTGRLNALKAECCGLSGSWELLLKSRRPRLGWLVGGLLREAAAESWKLKWRNGLHTCGGPRGRRMSFFRAKKELKTHATARGGTSEQVVRKNCLQQARRPWLLCEKKLVWKKACVRKGLLRVKASVC